MSLALQLPFSLGICHPRLSSTPGILAINTFSQEGYKNRGEEPWCALGREGSGLGAWGKDGNEEGGVSRLDDCYANDLTKNVGAFCVCGGVVREAVYFFIFFLVQLVGMTFFILVVTVGG